MFIISFSDIMFRAFFSHTLAFFNDADNLRPDVCAFRLKYPFLLVAQIYVKQRKSNVSTLQLSLFASFHAYLPNFMILVLSFDNLNSNLANRTSSSIRNFSTSLLHSKSPTTSSQYLIISV